MKEDSNLVVDSSGGPNKVVIIAAILLLAVAGFLGWRFVAAKVPVADVRLVDTRITFKFTAYKDHEEYFVSCSVENKINQKVKAEIVVDLGEVGEANIVNKIQTERTSVELQPLELKSAVIKFNIPKSKDGVARELTPRAKISGVVRV